MTSLLRGPPRLSQRQGACPRATWQKHGWQCTPRWRSTVSPKLSRPVLAGPAAPPGLELFARHLQAQTTAREREGSKDLRILWSRRRSEDSANTPPHSAVVADCKLLSQIWSDGPQQEVGSSGPTREEEEVGLRVVDPRDPVEEGGMLSTFLHEELLDELRLTYWNTQHPQSLLGWREVWISLPDIGIWLHHSGCSGEVLHPCRLDVITVPDLFCRSGPGSGRGTIILQPQWCGLL